LSEGCGEPISFEKSTFVYIDRRVLVYACANKLVS
jgi:hypothetical protein